MVMKEFSGKSIEYNVMFKASLETRSSSLCKKLVMKSPQRPGIGSAFNAVVSKLY